MPIYSSSNSSSTNVPHPTHQNHILRSATTPHYPSLHPTTLPSNQYLIGQQTTKNLKITLDNKPTKFLAWYDELTNNLFIRGLRFETIHKLIHDQQYNSCLDGKFDF